MKEHDLQVRLTRAEEEIVRLRRAVDELSVLNDLARSIGGSLDMEEIIAMIVRRSLRALRAEQGVITLVEPEDDTSMHTLIRTRIHGPEQATFHLHQNLLGWMHLHRAPLIINDPRNDSRFVGVKWDASISSVLCVPLLIKSQLIGILTIYNKTGGATFTEEDQRLLAIIASQSAQVIENARLYEQEKALVRVQEEIRHAARIQQDLLPKSAPAIPGYDLFGGTHPAQSVGGDYFDFIPAGDNRLAICLGDVTGKGLPAAMLMANVQATLRGQTLVGTEVRACIQRANFLLFQSTDPEKFVTLFYGCLAPEAGEFRYANAGHDNPILVSPGGEIRRLETGGIVLGIVDTFPFEEECIRLEPGSLLVIYSDGITEAQNALGEHFGEERLLEIVRDHRIDSARDISSAVIDAVRVHSGSRPQFDDITLVVLRRCGPGMAEESTMEGKT